MNGGSSYIDLPASIRLRKACVNVMNKSDDMCFVWSLLSAIFPVVQNTQRTSKYPQNPYEIFNLSGINFPTPLCDIPKFEKLNDISINVYGLDTRNKECDVVGPLHFTKEKKDRHVNLLYFTDGDRSHYCWIKNLSRLVSSQLSKHGHKQWICERCLQYFGTEMLLTRHEEDCSHFDAVKIEMPTDENKWLQFKNFKNKERHSFTIYADFEALTKPIDTCQPDPTNSYTNAYQKHEPCAIGFQVVCSYDDSLSFYDSYQGPESAKWFIQRMQHTAGWIEDIYKKIQPIIMTDENRKTFDNSDTCHMCNKPFSDDDEKVRDHDHLSGE